MLETPEVLIKQISEGVQGLLDLDPSALSGDEVRGLVRAVDAVGNQLCAAEAKAVGALDRRELWRRDVALDSTGWLAAHTTCSREKAARRLKLSRKLPHLPLVAAALAEGRLGDERAEAFARHLTAGTAAAMAKQEAELVHEVESLSVAQAKRYLRNWHQQHDPDGCRPKAPERSEVKASVTFGNRLKLDGDLDASDGAVVDAALRWYERRLFRAERATAETLGQPLRPRSQRLADALVQICQDAMAASDEAGAAEGAGVGRSVRRAKPLFTAIVQAESLRDAGEDLCAETDSGLVLDKEQTIRWLGDSSIARVVVDGPSVVLDAGRSQRVFTGALARAIIARDRHCTFPGCDRPSHWCELDHVQPWQERGPTSVANGQLLCSAHHRAKTEGCFTSTRDPDGTLHHWRPDGTEITAPHQA